MLRKSLVALALVALVASTASAQRGGGGRGGRGQGGFGNRGGSAMLLQTPEVQTELGLTDDQKKQIETMNTEIRQSFQNGGTGGNGTRPNFQNMTQEERDKALADMRARGEKVAKDREEKLSKILTSDQQTRLKQLELQSQGVSALVSAPVVDKLKITDDQKTKIQKIIDDARAARGQGGGFNPNATADERAAAAKTRADARAKTLKDALAVLTDDQLSTWGEMQGKAFKFPDNMGRGNFGGRGNRGRGGNRNGGNTTPPTQST